MVGGLSVAPEDSSCIVDPRMKTCAASWKLFCSPYLTASGYLLNLKVNL